MNFKDWLLNENTVAQELKKIPPDAKAELIKHANDLYKTIFNFNVDPNKTTEIVNWLTLNLYKDPSSSNSINNYKDFLIAKYNSINLKDPSYNLSRLAQDSQKFYDELKNNTKLGMKGAFGQTLIQFPDGWKWVDLEKSHCDIEAAAMGHCGNTKGLKDTNQNILSLRDPRNVPYLTFIDLGNGVLGEMKGRYDNKPEKKFHPYIIELLKHPRIKKIQGGGFAPNKNFSISDLNPEQKKEILNAKPDMINPPSSIIADRAAQDDDIIRNLIDNDILKSDGSVDLDYLQKIEHNNMQNINSVKRELQTLLNNPLLIGSIFANLGIQINSPLKDNVIQTSMNSNSVERIVPYKKSQPDLFNQIYQNLSPYAQQTISQMKI